MRIGGDSVIPVDVRIVAATNRNLENDVDAGRFRADLFYRLNLLRLEVPPLRNRLEDVPVLTGALSEKLQQRYGRQLCMLPEAMEALSAYPWPGNVRELENFLERLWLLSDADTVTAEAVRALLPNRPAPAKSGGALPDLTLAELESMAIAQALAAERGNFQKAAERLGLHRTTLYRKLQQIGGE